jgi:ATP-dependent RNA helicase DeaD
MENFSTLGLPQPLLNALEKMLFTTPTPIQAKAIPLALAGRDILGSAQTGTGKTGAFGIPLLAHLMKNPQSGALVMTPTRELAAQVADALKKMLDGSGQIKTALLIGGDSMYKQLQQLKARPRIIVGTPGRINDHLQQGTLNLGFTDFLVLDETDRMLDMGFEVQIERIVKRLPPKRQTLLFSATLPSHIVKLSDKYLVRPERIAVGSAHTPIAKIKQELIHLPVAEKYARLVDQLKARTGSVIVFVKTKRGADRMAKKLSDGNMSAQAIHGNLNQNQRTRVIQAFRDKKYRIMVATDVAARGLDIPHIEHVINYDLPQQPEDYIHRIGRTARAGAEGAAVCFITPEDRELWGEIHFLMNPGEKREARLPQGPRRGGGGGNHQSRRNDGPRRPHGNGGPREDAARPASSRRRKSRRGGGGGNGGNFGRAHG